MTTPCVCGHLHADECHCGCTLFEPDTGDDYTRTITPNYGGPYAKYTGRYARKYTLEEESA